MSRLNVFILLTHLLHLLLIVSPIYGQKLSEIVMNASEGIEVNSTIGTLYSPSGGRDASFLGISDVNPLFRIEPSGKVVVNRPIDIEMLCTERQLCCSYSQLCQVSYNVFVEGTKSGDMGQINLRIRILDVNDHDPQFRQPSGQVVQISEKAPIGTTVDIDRAIDADWSIENQVRKYTLHGPVLSNFFEIDNSELPNVRIKLREKLDYERDRVLTGFLEACDSRNCTTAPLTVNIIDVNDNRPFFHPPFEHNLTLPEDTPTGKVILELNATDYDSPPNARMRFEFVTPKDSSIPSTFHLDPNTGVISLARRLQADVQLNYYLQVRVREISDSSSHGDLDFRVYSFGEPQKQQRDTVSINIRVQDINNFAPSIRIISPPEGSEIWVPENSPPRKIVVLRVEDRDLDDNGRVSCRLDGAEDIFSLRQLMDSVYALHSLRVFDAEAEPLLFVNISCSDKGTPLPRTTNTQLVIRIEDENEFEPVFSKKEYSAKITENAPNNTFVLQVLAQDKDQSAQLEYSLRGDGERYFKIDPSSGKITTNERDSDGSGRLDREMTPEVTFFVLVRDAKPTQASTSQVVHTAQTTVTVQLIDENDNSPSFTDIGPFYLSENQPKHTKVNGRLHAEDPDEGLNGKVKYALQDVWDANTHIRKHNLFQLDETTGTLRALEPLDREQTVEYTLRVMACDMAPRDSRCTRVNVTVSVVDVNDNAPEWLFPVSSEDVVEESVNVTSDAAVPNQLVAQLVAHDRDAGQNGRVRYALHDPHSQVAFAVNATTGQVTVANRYYSLNGPSSSSLSSSETQQQTSLQPGVYRLRIRASDMGHPPLYSDTWLTIRVVGANTGIFGIQTGLLILLVLVTLIIAICLIAAIICIRRQTLSCKAAEGGGSSDGRAASNTGCCAGKSPRHPNSHHPSTPSHVPSYILPPLHHSHSDYPTFVKQNGAGPTAYVLTKSAGSIASSDHCDNGPGGGVCPITEMGVTEFYAPYGLTMTAGQAGEEAVRFLEVDTTSGGAAYLTFAPPVDVGTSGSPSVRLVGAYPAAYNTCDAASMLPTTSSTTGMLKFRQTSGSPQYRYSGRGNGEEIFELPDAGMGGLSMRYSGTHNPLHGAPPSCSEQFEGGSADSGRGVSEDEPPPAHPTTALLPCNVTGSDVYHGANHMSTFFCQSGSLGTGRRSPPC